MQTIAWDYALRRLPTDITSVFAVVISKRMIDVLLNDGEAYGERQTYNKFAPGHAVVTRDRRRSSWELSPGKLFILMRGEVDILDFVSCLCLHTVELQKLRAVLKPAVRV